MDFKEGVLEMLKNIDAKKSINLYCLKENLWGLYELIDGSSNSNFANNFHEQWDFIEEVYALEKEDQYKQTLDNMIIPKLKNVLTKFVKS